MDRGDYWSGHQLLSYREYKCFFVCLRELHERDALQKSEDGGLRSRGGHRWGSRSDFQADGRDEEEDPAGGGREEGRVRGLREGEGGEQGEDQEARARNQADQAGGKECPAQTPLNLLFQFQKTSKTGETVLREVRDKPHLDPLPLRNMSSDSAIQTIDFKVGDV